MPDPPSPTRAQIPSAIAASKPVQPDAFHPVPAGPAANSSTARLVQDGPSHHDYTENAPQAVVDAIAIEREREAKEAPPDMMVGSFQSWAGADGGGSSSRPRDSTLDLAHARSRHLPVIHHSNAVATWLTAGFHRVYVSPFGVVRASRVDFDSPPVRITAGPERRAAIAIVWRLLRRLGG